MRRRYGFKRLIIFLGLLPVLAVCLSFSIYVIHNQLSTTRDIMSDRALAAARQLSVVVAHTLEDRHYDLLDELTQSALEENGVRAVSVYDRNLELLSHSGPATETPDISGLSLSTPYQLVDNGKQLDVVWTITPPNNQPSAANSNDVLGWAKMSYSWHQYELMKYQSLLSGSMFLGLTVLFCVIIFSYINHNISRDLKGLRDAARRLSSGERDIHFFMPGNDEFTSIAEELNHLNASQIQALKELQQNLEQSNSDLRETLETLEVQNIELDLARREAITANRMKSEFLANTSHEIRTPLNSILGFSNILLKADIKGRQREAVETIRNSATNLLTIINDILDFSKLEAGKLVFDNAPVQLREMMEDTLIMLAPGAADKGLDLALFIEPDCPESVLSDSLRLRQILTNLINNAIKFTPCGHIRIDLHCKESDEESALLEFKVSDSGIGISAEQRKLIFGNFTQADASVTRQYGGTGLGLVIVQGLVKEMGGEVGLESEPGRGSTFWFTLRLPIDHSAVEMRNFTALNGQRIAVYDRSQYYAESLKALLQGWGMEVHGCRELSELDSQCEYTLISLNKDEDPGDLPPNNSQHPTVVLSAHAEDIEHNDGRIWMSKPVSHVRLFDALRSGYSTKPHQRSTAYSGSAVLIVDDNPSNLHILSSFLGDFGIKPVTAQNGIEAVAYCQDQRFELIFIDIQMPQMDGIEASRQIRETGLNIHTPIAAISAYLAPDNPSQLRAAGINDYLSKPVNEAQLEKILARHLSPSCALPNIIEPIDNDTVPRPVDIKQCLSLSKNRPELAKDMLKMLLDQLPAQRRDIAQSLHIGDWEQLDQLNHGLKGSCCYTGVPHLQASTTALEAALNNGAADTTNAAQAVLRCIDELQTWHEEHDLDVMFD